MTKHRPEPVNGEFAKGQSAIRRPNATPEIAALEAATIDNLLAQAWALGQLRPELEALRTAVRLSTPARYPGR